MKIRLSSISLVALSLLTTVAFADPACPVSGLCPDSIDGNACLQQGAAGSDAYCNCMANDATFNCVKYFSKGNPAYCGHVPAVGQPFISGNVDHLMTEAGQEISMHQGIVNFCRQYVVPASSHTITAGDCEYDNSAIISNSGAYNSGLCAGKWGNRTKPF